METSQELEIGVSPSESFLSKGRCRIIEDVEIFGRELDIRESADQSVKREQPSDRHQLEEKKEPVLPTASGLMAKPIACTFCNGPHNP